MNQKSSLTAFWWHNPAVVFLTLNLLLGLITLLLPNETFLDLWGTPKYFGVADFSLILGIIVSFWFGYLINRLTTRFDHNLEAAATLATCEDIIAKAYDVSFVLTMLGYLMFLYSALIGKLAWGDISAVFNAEPGAIYRVKESVALIPGLTTLTQFGPAAAILGILSHRPRSQTRRRLWILLVLASLRAFLRAERLALLEIGLPLALLWSQYSFRRRRKLGRMLPVLGLCLLILYFGIGEYSRSWINYYASRLDQSYWIFVLARLAGYYTTAFNNGALYMHMLGKLPIPYFILKWMWDFPVIGQIVSYDAFAGFPITDVIGSQGRILSAYGNPELNNHSGLFSTVLDLGPAIAFLYWGIVGYITNYLYRRFRNGSVEGRLLYPFIFVGIVEAPRVLYLHEGRAFPSLIMLSAVVLLIRVRATRMAGVTKLQA